MTDFKTMFGNRIYILAAVIILGSGGLFAYLESQGLVIECENKFAEVGVPTNISCTVFNPKARSVYLYNYGDWKITFTPEIEDFGLYIKYYGKYRFTNFTMATRLGNIPDDRKYVFVFPTRATKYFQLRVLLNDTQIIKFDFGALDPVIIGYQYIYENLSKEVPVYKYKIIEIKPIYNSTNSTWFKGYNYIERTLTGYKKEYYNGKRRIGAKVGDKTILNPNINIKDNTISTWTIPIGDRNFDEYGKCRAYEKQKGVCKETNILRVIK